MPNDPRDVSIGLMVAPVALTSEWYGVPSSQGPTRPVVLWSETLRHLILFAPTTFLACLKKSMACSLRLLTAAVEHASTAWRRFAMAGIAVASSVTRSNETSTGRFTGASLLFWPHSLAMLAYGRSLYVWMPGSFSPSSSPASFDRNSKSVSARADGLIEFRPYSDPAP